MSLIGGLDSSTALNNLYIASKTCVSSNEIFKVMTASNDISEEDKIKQICMLVKKKHLSVLEHMSFTFCVAGVSRALLAQYTRHRVGMSISVQSQRYVKFGDKNNFIVVVPRNIMYNEDGYSEDTYIPFIQEVERSLNAYCDMLSNGINPQDARSILPMCIGTQFVTSLNLRSFLDIYEKRVLIPGSQYEITTFIKTLAQRILNAYPWMVKVLSEIHQRYAVGEEQAKRELRELTLEVAMDNTTNVDEDNI